MVYVIRFFGDDGVGRLGVCLEYRHFCQVRQGRLYLRKGRISLCGVADFFAVAVFALCLTAGALVMRFAPKRESAEVAHKGVWAPSSWLGTARALLLCVAILFGGAIFTLILDYILIAKVSFALAKRFVLLGVTAEVAVVAVIGVILRKHIVKRSNVLCVAVSVALLALYLGMYLLLYLADRQTVENVFFFAGSGAFVLIPMFFVVGFLLWAGTRKKRFDVEDI